MDGAVGNGGEMLIVGHDDKRLAKLITQIEEQLMQFGFVLGIERARRFIGQDDCRMIHQSTCHSHSLLLSTGEFCGFMMGTVAQSQELQQFLCPLLRLFVGNARDIGGNHDILYGRKLRQQLMKLEHKAQMTVTEIAQCFLRESGNINTIYAYPAGIRTVERTDNLKQCGLTGTTGAYNAHHLTFLYVQVDTFQHLQRPEALGNIFCYNHFSVI